MSYYFIIILNLFMLESMLSIDNAAVLSIMVSDLPKDRQLKALRYGIGGAFLFRGISLFIASWLIRITWLKIIGGGYLLYLSYQHFFTQNNTESDSQLAKKPLTKYLGNFWSTVLLVEAMDMVFSIDNIFASVSVTQNIYLICAGVFMGIIAMRFVAGWFTVLMNKYPFLESSAYIVIAILGIRLVVVGFLNISTTKVFDIIFSTILLSIFFLPLLKNKIYAQAKI